MSALRRSCCALLGLLVAGSATSCTNQNSVAPPLTGPTYEDQGPATTVAQGFAWDPEAFWFTAAVCGKDCPFPPVLVPGLPDMERSELQGLAAALVDPLTGGVAYQSPALTDVNGGWSISGISSRAAVPYFSAMLPPPTGATLKNPPLPPGVSLPPVPPGNYVPTVDLTPLFTHESFCWGHSSPVVSDAGVLQAVANFISGSSGQSVTVSDLLDPTKYGGVLVTWLYMPSTIGQLRAPAGGVQVATSGGDTYDIEWAPPQALPPQFGQSDRGYFVNPSPNPIGVPLGTYVTVMPATLAPTPIQVTVTDPVNDANTGRPWAFPLLPPVTVAPGMASFIELPGNPPGQLPPAASLCIQ